MTSFYNENGLALEKYFVGLYEKEVEGNITRHINYIMAGDGITAIVIEEEENGNTTSETYFTYKDHLGSIVALTDENGDVVLEQSFDAWGRYRNPNDWTYNNVNESPTWLRGYTGHEHLPHFELINMNGRIYDPILGRMLSPDRYIQDPTSSQSYNRYSYVWNNPLRYTDPSGDAVVAGIIIGAAVGAYIGGAAVNNTINITEWEWNARTASGIISGAIVGAFGGAYIGAALAGKLGVKAMVIAKLNAATIKSGLVSGGLNMMYNYEEGQSFGTSMGYFGSGFVGGAIGVDLVAPLIGMAASGVGNMVVLGVDSGGEATTREYAQKFVSGALNAYAGINIFGDVNYMKMADGNYLGGYKDYKGISKAWRAGWINQASDFAYSSQDAFNNRSIGERILMFAGAGASATIGETFGPTFGNSSDFLVQQTIQATFRNNPQYLPFIYEKTGEKLFITNFKNLFYNLNLK